MVGRCALLSCEFVFVNSGEEEYDNDPGIFTSCFSETAGLL